MNYILIAVALIGFLPMIIILVRKQKNDKLRKHGISTMATVRELFGVSFRGINIVRVEYKVDGTGETISKNLRVAGLPYAVGDQLPMFYDEKNPQHMQLDMKKGFMPMLIFTLIIAIFIVWACFKIKEMVNSGAM